jgi:hypothetical protein
MYQNMPVKNSVPSPLFAARNSAPIYYDPEVDLDTYSSTIGVPPAALLRISPICRAALYVIFAWNMRSAEYLRSRIEDIRPYDRLFIHGAKGSQSYILHLAGINRQFEGVRSSSPGRLVSGITYHKLWAACVKAGIGMLLPSHTNSTRTHLSRYSAATAALPDGIKAVTDVLRHRSARTAHYYLPQEGA